MSVQSSTNNSSSSSSSPERQEGGGQASKRPRTQSDDCSDSEADDQFEDVPLEYSADWMPELGTVELVFGDDPLEPLTKKKATVSQAARLLRRHHHMGALLGHLLETRVLNHACSRPLLQAIALSLAPAALVDMVAAHRAPGGEPRREWVAHDLARIVETWHAGFRLHKMSTRHPRDPFHSFDNTDCDIDARLLACSANAPWIRVALLVALLRALAFETRLCVGVCPPSLRLTAAEGAVLDSALRGEYIGSQSSHTTDSAACYWAEAFDPVADAWTALDRPRDSIRQCTYIVAADAHGGIADVTRRYRDDYAHLVAPQRLESLETRQRLTESRDGSWWDRLLSRWPVHGHNVEHEQPTAMPRRLADFAAHPVYALERHLGQAQLIYPRTPVVGRVRGEAVFLRENVHTLHTAMAWHRQGRAVKPTATPAKTIVASSGTESTVRQLFGRWQTEPLQVPPVVDGRVPRNEHGRLDLFVPEMLPLGAAHVRGPHAWRVCQDLGVDAVPAVVGFAFSRRRGAASSEARAVVDGVVIPATAKHAVEQALREDERAREIKDVQARELRAVRHWRRLMRALWVRCQVDAAFARRPADGLTFEPVDQ
ncbi:hypothetical protein GGI07_003173 [Coemansia sp. Benny D115]|nr:hypothetical protein GGI07_003173 [Coemansia sp. Benny D115]